MTRRRVSTAHPPPRGRELLKALRVRNFALFWTGQLVSGTGTWMQMVAMAWLVLDISRSPATLGWVTTLQFLPVLLFALPAGVLADRVPKRGLLIATQTLAAVQALVLGVLATIGTPQIWQLALLGFTLGVSNAFTYPTQQAFVSEMVDPPLVPQAVALNSVQFNLTRMVGTALGGLAIAHFASGAVFFVNAASFLASLGALLMMRPRELRTSAAQPAHRGAMREGVRYAVRTPAVLFVLGTLAVVGTLGFNWPVAAPLLARDVLDVQAVGFGALMAAFGAGALLAGLGLVVIGVGNDRRLVGAGVGLGMVLVLLGVSHSYPLSLALMGLAGLSGTVFTTTANTRLQLLSPDRLRGRVMSLFVLLMAGSTPIGASLLGQGAAAFGVSVTMVVSGVAALAGLVGLVAYRAVATGAGSAIPGFQPPAAPPQPIPDERALPIQLQQEAGD